MKILTSIFQGSLLAVIVCFLSAATTVAEEPQPFSVDWLQKGCTAIVVGENDPDNFTKNQQNTATQSLYWLNGFMVGANAMCLAIPGELEESKIMYPPPEWMDIATLATQLLAFLNENQEIIGSAKAREFMLAFYYLKHPAGTERHRFYGQSTLDKIIKRQDKAEMATPRKPSD